MSIKHRSSGIVLLILILSVIVILTILIHPVLILKPSLTGPLGPIEKLAHSHIGKIGHIGIDVVRLLERRGDRLVGMCHQSIKTWWLPDRSVRQGQRRFIGRLDDRFQTEGG